MYLLGFVVFLILVVNFVKAAIDHSNVRREQAIKMLDVNVKAFTADVARAKAADEDMKRYPSLVGVGASYAKSAKSLGMVSPVVASAPAEVTDQAVCTDTSLIATSASVEPSVSATPEALSPQFHDTVVDVIPTTEAMEIKAAETVILVVGPGARVVIGHYPEFGMRLATLVAPGVNEKLKIYDHSDDEELVIHEADLLGRSRLKSLRDVGVSTIEATNVRVM